MIVYIPESLEVTLSLLSATMLPADYLCTQFRYNVANKENVIIAQ